VTLPAAGALLCVAAGLAVLSRTRTLAASRGRVLALALLFAGTSLAWTVWPATDTRAAGAFLLATLAVACLDRAPGTLRLAGGALLLAAAIALALGTEAARLLAPRLGEALFSSRHGLLFWNPLLWMGLAGLPPLARRDRSTAGALAAGLGAVCLASACLPAGASGPWAARRFTPALALLAPGLTLALDAVVAAAARRPASLLAGAGALLIVWNLLFMEQYRRGMLPRDATVSFPAVAQNNAAVLSELAGSPPAWPANWAFAWRTGLPAERFDLLAGKRLPADASGGRDIDVGALATDAALLLDGWSVRHPCEEAVCRDVEGRARLLAPLEAPGEFTLAVRAAGEGALSAAVNGERLPAQPLAPGLATLRFPAGGSWKRLNEVSLAVAPGGRARVDRVRLEPRAGAS
jgi:hypothetical protein